jgi:hypothetical protein
MSKLVEVYGTSGLCIILLSLPFRENPEPLPAPSERKKPTLSHTRTLTQLSPLTLLTNDAHISVSVCSW